MAQKKSVPEFIPFSFEANTYYTQKYTKEASQFYENKMLQLGTRDELRTEIPGKKLPEHMAFKIDPIILEKEHRMYEFLIEYKTTAPSEGIYYGCRGITLEGGNHMANIEHFRREWDDIKYEICVVLNNTFPGKDFSHRFKMTDNANDQTYWLTWITLYEDEDINHVGMRSIKIMRFIMQDYLKHPKNFTQRALPQKNINDDIAFTNECYKNLLNHIKLNKAYKKDDRIIKLENATVLFNKFIKNGEREKLLSRHPYYEKAWQCNTSNAEFARLMYCLFQYITKECNAPVPWAQIIKVFLDRNGSAFDSSIRTQVKAAYTNEEELINETRNFLQNIMKL